MRSLLYCILPKYSLFKWSTIGTSQISYTVMKSLTGSLLQFTSNESFINSFPKMYSTNIRDPDPSTLLAEEDMRQFVDVFPNILHDLTDPENYSDIPEVADWYSKVLQYNVPEGKKTRGLTVASAYRSFCALQQVTPENIRLAYVLGWCIELLQAYLLVFDDMIDEGEMRRGRPCWHRLSEVNNKAVYDGAMIENGVYVILKKYFQHKPYYVNLIHGFQDACLKTLMGQSMDMLTCRSFQKFKTLEKFTMEHYKAIVKYKTMYYTFYLPVSSAMYMFGVQDVEKYNQVENVLLEMGYYFQIQDDYLDCFGDVDEIGKIGMDIQEGKCSWPIVVALQKASEEQKQILEQCYGDKDPKKVASVKQIYTDIGLPSIFAAYEEDSYKLITNSIQQLPEDIPPDIFYKILNKMYKRSK